jgi:hypothetical protein
MRALSSSGLLDLWDKGSTLHPLDRGLLLLTAALPEVPLGSVADWPLGRRNRELFALHGSWFGSSLSARMACSRCEEQMEFELDCDQLMPANTAPDQQLTVVFRGRTFRVPNSRDLAFGLADESDPEKAAIRLLESCRLASHDPASWSQEDIASLGELMAQADPGAETRIRFRCTVCGHEQDGVLDIAAFLWAEIVAHAKRLLREVHTLASAYGWSEEQVLSLGATRRAFYLEMVEA